MELVRGTSAAFDATFTDPAGTPLVPADPEQFPQVTIKNPDGTVVVTGLGKQFGVTQGHYRFNWHVPSTAMLSAEDSSWSIEWVLVTLYGHTAIWNDTFDVVDKIESTPEERQYTYLAREGASVRALIRWPTKLSEVSLEIRSTRGSLYRAVDGVATNATEEDEDNPDRLIVERQQGGEYAYYYDTGPIALGEYLVIWTYRESEISQTDETVQMIRVAPYLFWHYAFDLKILIDKLQKHFGILQAYSDSDVYSYVLAGLDVVNGIHPSTTWALSDIPLGASRGVRTAIIYASAMHALTAQQIMEIELGFDHSGQTVNLTYNHDYGAVLGTMGEQLTRFAEEKTRLVRLAEGAAYSGARPKNWRLTNYVWRIDNRLKGLIPPGGGYIWQNLGL